MAQSEDLSSGQLPLKGVVLCCTSLPQDVRTKLSDAALQMGATHKLDLTSDVTHLIVGNIATAKYRYVAKDRPDIKVLEPSWIEAVRELWMAGSDVDVEALEKDHRTPPFKDLQICVTGFQNIEQRNDIAHTAESHGAAYHGDLTKDVSHLIAQKPEGAKYNAAKSWNLHVVSLRWFEDSMLRGMALDEKLYDPAMPLEEQGVGAFRRHRERASLSKRKSDIDSQDAARKKLRRTASTRLESQSQDMWQDISAHSISSRTEGDQWNDDEDVSQSHVSNTTATKIQQPQKTAKDAEQPTADPSSAPAGLFSGSYILLHGFDRSRANLLRKYLVPNGAEIVTTPKELEDASQNVFFKTRYLLVPHAQSPPPSPPPDVPAGTIVATEWWVERCIHYKQLFDPSTDALSRPLADATIPELSKTVISTTGFAGVDLRQVAEAVKLMGATYQEQILPSTSVLISGSDSIRREKAFYAKKKKIPVVTADWLWACLNAKSKVSFDDFLVTLPTLEAKDFPGEPSPGSPAASDQPRAVSKDTGKAKDPSAVKRLSNTRSKHATPTLSLQARKDPPAVSASRAGPFVHEDDDDDESPAFGSGHLGAQITGDESGGATKPLQEVSPNLSPSKTSEPSKQSDDCHFSKTEAEFKATTRAESPSKPTLPPQSPEKEQKAPNDTSFEQPPQNLNADLAELIHLRTTSRPNSAAGRSPEKRKKRPLGRAASGISNRSNSGSFSQAIAADDPEPSEADGYNRNKEAQAPLPPSTQLGYETAEAEAHRLQMSKKMGTKLLDDHGLTRLASVGTVKDTTITSQSVASGKLRKQKGR